LVDSLEGDGFNLGIFDAVIPMAVHVDRAETEAAQVEQLLQSGKAFSASGQWNFCDSRIGNAGVTLRAQKQQLALNEAARLRVADKKSEAQLKHWKRHRQCSRNTSSIHSLLPIRIGALSGGYFLRQRCNSY
jgi:hypothetical protein